MRPLIFTLPHGLAFLAVWIWAYIPEYRIVQAARAAVKKEGTKDGGSIKVIVIAGMLGMLLALPAAWIPATVIAPRSRLAVYYIGIVLMILGSVLRRLCWRALGDNFTGDVRARSDQPVIGTGPYRFVRHPSYTAGMLMFVGVGVALGNWVSLILLFVATAISYAYRVQVEERALLAEIGEPYQEFMRTRKRFVPFVI